MFMALLELKAAFHEISKEETLNAFAAKQIPGNLMVTIKSNYHGTKDAVRIKVIFSP